MKNFTTILLGFSSLSAFLATAATAQTTGQTPTQKVPMCLQTVRDGKYFVPCTGVVPVDTNTGNPLNWADLLGNKNTSSGSPSTSSTPVQNSDGSKIATDANLSNAVNQLNTVNSNLNTLFPKGGSIGNTAFGISGSLPTGTNTIGAVNVNGTVPVSGSVSVSNFPATQAVSGTVTANVGSTNGLALDSSVNGLFKSGQSIGNTGFAAQGSAGTAVQQGNAAAASANSLNVYVGGQNAPLNVVTTPASGASTTVTQTNASNLNATVVGTGTFGVQVTNLPATQPVSGTVTANIGSAPNLNVVNLTGTNSIGTVGLNAGTNTIGSIANTGFNVNNFPASQTVSGTVTANLGTLNGAATSALQSTLITNLGSPLQQTGGSVSITGTPSVTVTNLPSNQTVSGTVSVSNFPTNQGVSQSDVYNSGSIALGTSNAAYMVAITNGQSTGGVVLSGITGSGATLLPEGSYDGVNYVATSVVQVGNKTLLSAITTDGQYKFNAGGRRSFRFRVSVTGTGTAAAISTLSVAPFDTPVATLDSNGYTTTNLGNLNGAATTALQSTIITNLGSPFQAGGSIGNTSFASTQSGTWNVGLNTGSNTIGAVNINGTVPVSGTVTANLGTLNGAATAANQPSVATAGSAIPTTGTLLMGSDGTNARAVSMTASGVLYARSSGDAGSGSTDTGNPVKIGGYASNTAPTAVTAGQRVNSWYTLNGAANVSMVDQSGNFIGAGVATNIDGQSAGSSTARQEVVNRNTILNSSSTYDRVRDANTANATTGTGIAAAGMMGKYNATLPAYTDGQYGNLQLDPSGYLSVASRTGASALADGATNSPLVMANRSANLLYNVVYNEVFNGTTWDRMRDVNSTNNTTGTGISAAGMTGYMSSAMPTLGTSGNYGRAWFGLSGSLVVGGPAISDGITTTSVSGMADTNGNSRHLGVVPSVYDGSTFRYFRDTNSMSGSTGTGLLGTGGLAWDNASSVYRKVSVSSGIVDASSGTAQVATSSWLWNNATYDRARSDTGTTNTGTAAVSPQPSSSAGAAIAPTTVANVSSQVAKATPGNVYGLNTDNAAVSGTYELVYDATAAPTAGASLTTSLILWHTLLGSGQTMDKMFMPAPIRCQNGCTILYSTSLTTFTAPATAPLLSTVMVK